MCCFCLLNAFIEKFTFSNQQYYPKTAIGNEVNQSGNPAFKAQCIAGGDVRGSGANTP